MQTMTDYRFTGSKEIVSTCPSSSVQLTTMFRKLNCITGSFTLKLVSVLIEKAKNYNCWSKETSNLHHPVVLFLVVFLYMKAVPNKLLINGYDGLLAIYIHAH